MGFLGVLELAVQQRVIRVTMLCALRGARSPSCSPDMRQGPCSSGDRRMEEGTSDSGVLKTVRWLPISPNNPSGPGKGHLENV